MSPPFELTFWCSKCRRIDFKLHFNRCIPSAKHSSWGTKLLNVKWCAGQCLVMTLLHCRACEAWIEWESTRGCNSLCLESLSSPYSVTFLVFHFLSASLLLFQVEWQVCGQNCAVLKVNSKFLKLSVSKKVRHSDFSQQSVWSYLISSQFASWYLNTAILIFTYWGLLGYRPI